MSAADDDDDDNDGIDRDILRPYPFFFEWPVSDARFEHCCVYMGFALFHLCDMHPTPFECPDNEFVYNEVFDEYGSIKHNPEYHITMLRFCPFCGTATPRSRRKDWERELVAMGFDLFGEEMGAVLESTGSYTRAWRAMGVPERYLTAQWRLNREDTP